MVRVILVFVPTCAFVFFYCQGNINGVGGFKALEAEKEAEFHFHISRAKAVTC